MTNHGTVRAEIVEYRTHAARIVVCELQDGWHVVEVYIPGERTARYVCETLAEARRIAREVEDWVTPFVRDPDSWAAVAKAGRS